MVTFSPALCPRPARGVQSGGWVGSGPTDIGGRPIGGGHPVLQESKTEADLSPMVRSMQDPAPEHPDALPPHVEEGNLRQPEPLILSRQQRKAGSGERD